MSDNTNREKEINDILGQLRASVDKQEQAKKDKKSDMFDREIAALIEKQLASRDTSSAYDNEQEYSGVVTQEASPFYSEEIGLNDFVTDEQAALEQEDIIDKEPIAQEEQITEAEEDEETEVVFAEEEFDNYEEIVEDEDVAEVEVIVDDEETVEVEEIVESEKLTEVPEDSVETVVADEEELQETESSEIPPAVFEALQAAFAVDNEDFVDQIDQSDEDDPIIEEILPIEEDEPIIEEILPVEEEESVIEEILPIEEEDPVVEEIFPIEEEDPVIEEILPIEEDDLIIEEILPIEEPAVETIVETTEQEQPIEEPQQIDATSQPMEEQSVETPVVVPVSQEVEPVSDNQETDDISSEAWAYRGEEYRDHRQDEVIQSDYNKCRAATVIKLIVSLLICGLVGFMENIGLFGFLLIRPFEPTETPAIFIWTVMGLTLVAALLCFRQLKNGVVSLFKFDPEPHAIAFISLLAGIVYDIVMLIVLPEQLMLYNFPVMLCLSLSLLYDLVTICREKNSFDVVSDEGVRYSPRRESRQMESKYNSRPAVKKDGKHRRVYSMTSGRFSGGYFRRTNEKKKGVYILNFMLLPLLAVGFVELVIALSLRCGWDMALRAFAATVQLALPMPLFLWLVLPPLCASVRLKRRGCAIIGDSAVDEFSRPKLLIFNDRDMFPSERIGTKGLKLYDGFELYDVLVKTGSLFASIGGPLGEIFESENAKYHRIQDVKLLKVERGGVEALLDGKVNILAGNIDFIEKYGIYPKRIPRDEQLTAEGVVSIIYIVIDSRPAARLYADYRTDEAFESQISALCYTGDAAAIRTSDPGIDENMISRKRTRPDYELSVIRPGVARDGDELDNFDGGIVSLNDPRGVVDAVNECHKIKKSRYISMVVSLFVYLANIIVATTLVTLKLIPYISSGLVVLYMLMLILPVIFLPGVSGGSKK